MDLKFPVRSKFFEPIEAALSTGRWPLKVALGGRGLDRETIATIRRDNPISFEVEWEANDSSWFSARLRAAACVLQRNGHFGKFRLEHRDGDLTIERR